MDIGLNAGFGDSLVLDFAGIATHGFDVIRQDVYAHHNIDEIAPLVHEFAGEPVTALFLVGGGNIGYPDGSRIEPAELASITAMVIGAAQAAELTQYAIEIGNEPDIAVPGYSEDPRAFADAVSECLTTARGLGFTGLFISGGIANLNNRGFRYLSRCCQTRPAWPPPDLVIGFHRYPEAGRGPLAPHDRFKSRSDEWRTFKGIIGDQPCACTEFGYQTSPGEPLTLTDDDVAEAVLWDLDFYATRKALMGCVYQLNDGPGDSYLDKYGVRYLDGVWKPVAEAIQAKYA
jgi:hypothetical protein